MNYLYFTSASCGPCKQLTPVIMQKKEEGYNIEIVSIDTDEGLKLAQQHGVLSVPALAIKGDAPAARLISKKQLNDLLI